MDGLVAVEVRPDNAVEADEVIDMVMGQEDGFKVREPIVAQYRVVAAVNQATGHTGDRSADRSNVGRLSIVELVPDAQRHRRQADGVRPCSELMPDPY